MENLDRFRPSFLELLAFPIFFFLMASQSVAQGLGHFQLGDAKVFPSLELSYLATDNGFRTNSNQTEASAAVVRPEIRLLAENSSVELMARYEGDYSANSEDSLSYIDHLMALELTANFSKRSKLTGFSSFSLDHHANGTGVGASLNLDEPVVYSVARAGLIHDYGANRARGNLRSQLNFESRDYKNHDEFTDGYAYKSIEPSLRFSYRVSGDTRAYTEFRYRSLDFDNDYFDRMATSLFGGMLWDVTGKFGGRIGIGATDTVYSIGTRGDGQVAVAEGELYFFPKPYSKVELEIKRAIAVADWNVNEDGVDYTTIENMLSLNWRHEWSSRVVSEIVADVTQIDRECVYDDELRTKLAAEFTVKFRSWFEIGLAAASESRSVESCQSSISDGVIDEYDVRNISGLIRLTI